MINNLHIFWYYISYILSLLVFSHASILYALV